MSVLRPLRRAVLFATGVSLLMAAPASAHPFVRGGEAPVDSLVTVELTMAHGCASEIAGEGDPTTEVAVEVPDWLRIVSVPEPDDGWAVTLEPDEVDVEVVTWTNPESTEPAPAFEMEVVVSGEPGEERFLAVFQSCEQDSYRWIGTPDEPADDPAVRLRTIAADPDRPAPPLPDPDGASDGAGHDADELDDPSETDSGASAQDGDAPDAEAQDVASEDADPADSDADAVVDGDAQDQGDDPAAAADEGNADESSTTLLLTIGVLVVGGAVVGAIAIRRRRVGT